MKYNYFRSDDDVIMTSVTKPEVVCIVRLAGEAAIFGQKRVNISKCLRDFTGQRLNLNHQLTPDYESFSENMAFH